MFSRLEAIESRFFKRLGRPQPAGFVQRSSFWLSLTMAAGLGLSFLHGALGGLAEALWILSLVALTPLLLLLLLRWTTQRALWKVRNRLIVTCLLMGLAPVVLFGTLAAIAAYLFSGQFATNTAVAALGEQLDEMKDKSLEVAGPIAHSLERNPGARVASLPPLAETRKGAGPQTALRFAAWHDGKPLALQSDDPDELALSHSMNAPLPAWVHLGFSGVVEEGGRLYLRALNGYIVRDRSVVVLSSMPLAHGSLSSLAVGLGALTVFPPSGGPGERDPDEDRSDGGGTVGRGGSRAGFPPPFQSVSGGTLPGPTHFYDTPVYFTVPLHLHDWGTGAEVPAQMLVVSRPALLYAKLFANSVRVGTAVRNALLFIAVLFGLLELLAFLMAVRLSQTITRSVADLYGATRQIDQGNFAYRIPVKRRDQLAALATSFNTMAGSLGDLVEEQREKERLLRELEIAQEVQRTFFPQTPAALAGFELHGVCKPARTVSGDYYDFILAGEGRICFALGDISGKGISAALLMASLHSAVRAYHLSEDNKHLPPGLPGGQGGALTSPGKMLALLNRHLYASTQPEKYATLFLACYDSHTRRLTYSNGGQPPPLVLCANGGIERLDCGGSVIGLLDGLEYEEATVTLEAGDLLVAYSDGITEPENSRGEFGETRLVHEVQKVRHHSLANISGHTMRALEAWIGDAEQPDDITLVLARQG